MIDNGHIQNDVNPMTNLGLLLVTLISSWVANSLDYADVLLSILLKTIPVISFIFFVVINYKTLITNFKEIWNKLKCRSK